MKRDMRIRARLGLVLASAALVAAAGCSGGAAPQGGSGSSGTASSGQALFEEHCSVCHPTSRALQVQKDRQGWESTVSRMRGHGARLSDDEAAAVVDYLVAKDGGK